MIFNYTETNDWKNKFVNNSNAGNEVSMRKKRFCRPFHYIFCFFQIMWRQNQAAPLPLLCVQPGVFSFIWGAHTKLSVFLHYRLFITCLNSLLTCLFWWFVQRDCTNVTTSSKCSRGPLRSASPIVFSTQHWHAYTIYRPCSCCRLQSLLIPACSCCKRSLAGSPVDPEPCDPCLMPRTANGKFWHCISLFLVMFSLNQI
jgi:hypothetical protein